MKHLIRMSSLLTMVMLLAMGTMLTSCGDDDDDNGGSTTVNKIEADGTELSVIEATYDMSDLNENNYDIRMKFSNGSVLTIMLSGDKHGGKVTDLSKAESTPDGWSWLFVYTGGGIFIGDGEYNDPDPFDAGSTMKVTCLNKTTGEFELQFYIKKDGHLMTGYYKAKLQGKE